jgi:hypothetical protein
MIDARISFFLRCPNCNRLPEVRFEANEWLHVVDKAKMTLNCSFCLHSEPIKLPDFIRTEIRKRVEQD